jgi:hypothetical protein
MLAPRSIPILKLKFSELRHTSKMDDPHFSGFLFRAVLANGTNFLEFSEAQARGGQSASRAARTVAEALIGPFSLACPVTRFNVPYRTAEARRKI